MATQRPTRGHPLSRAAGRLVASAVITLGLSTVAAAGQLVYTPVNPSFGGDAFNSTHLLSIAQQEAQRRSPNDPLAGLDLSSLSDLGGSLDQMSDKLDQILERLNQQNPPPGP